MQYVVNLDFTKHPLCWSEKGSWAPYTLLPAGRKLYTAHTKTFQCSNYRELMYTTSGILYNTNDPNPLYLIPLCTGECVGRFLLHTLWQSKSLCSYWNAIFQFISTIIKKGISPSPSLATHILHIDHPPYWVRMWLCDIFFCSIVFVSFALCLCCCYCAY